MIVYFSVAHPIEGLTRKKKGLHTFRAKPINCQTGKCPYTRIEMPYVDGFGSSCTQRIYTGNDIGLLIGISIEVRPDSTHTEYSLTLFLDLCEFAGFHGLAFAELCLFVLLEDADDIVLTLFEATYLLHDEGSKNGM